MKKHFKSILSVVLSLCVVLLSFSVCSTSFAATAKGSISGVTNTATAIKVTWTKDTTKTGYNIYRKAGTETSWKNVKKITKNTTTSWNDTNVSNGKKYVYKVRSYKGTKITANSKTKTIYRLSTPAPTVSRASKTSITIKATNKSATGFQIKYSKKSDMSSATTINVTGTSLNKTITNLSQATVYYVKVRAYKTVNGTKYYSAYSNVENVTTYYVAYTNSIYTSIYSKPDSNSTKTTIRYMSKVYMYDVVDSFSKGKYQKLKYNGKFYYVYIPAGTEKFMTTPNPYNYSGNAENPYAQQIIDKAVWIFKNWKTSYPITGEKDKNWTVSNGVHYFDCSGFISYVLTDVFKNDNKIASYKVSQNVEKLSKTGAIYNVGLNDEFSPEVIFDKKNDARFSFDMLEAGDIIFYDMPPKEVGSTKSPNHCTMYLGDNQFIHSTQSADGVEILPLMNNFAEADRVARVLRFAPKKIILANAKAIVNNKEANPSTGNIYKTIKLYGDEEQSSVVATMTKGDEVTIITANTLYAYVSYNNVKGYVFLGKEDATQRGISYRFDLIQ